MLGQSKTVESVPVATKEFINTQTVRIRLSDEVEPNAVVDELNKLFDNLFRDGVYRIILDLSTVEYPGGNFIAMLIGRTMEARRWNGDICLVNVKDSVKNHFGIFTPLTYLSIDKPFPEEFGEDVFQGIAESNQLEEGIPRSLHMVASVYSLNRITNFVTSLAQNAGMEELDLSKLKIAVYEACMNVIEHGYRFEPGKMIGVEMLKEDGKVLVTVTDRGRSFDFYREQGYDVEDAFHGKKTGGFGLFIIKRSVDDVKYDTDPKTGNRLTLVKKIKAVGNPL